MKNLLWAELRKLRRLRLPLLAPAAAAAMAAVIFLGGSSPDSGIPGAGQPGWYLSILQPWATLLALPALIALFGGCLACREEQEDTRKALLLIPVNEKKMAAAKLILTFFFSIAVYLFLFALAFLGENILYSGELPADTFRRFLSMYLLEGAGVFLAVSPIVALTARAKRSCWLALGAAELYSLLGLFMSMSNTLKAFYPITAVFGAAGYYEASPASRLGSVLALLLCGGLSALILMWKKERP